MKIILFITITILFISGLFVCSHPTQIDKEKDGVNNVENNELKKVVTINNVNNDESLIGVSLKGEKIADLKATYINKSELTYIYNPNKYSLQILNDKQWINIYPLDHIGFDSVGGILEHEQTIEESIDLLTMYGELENGYYRIIKEFDENKKDPITGFQSEDRLNLEVIIEFQIYQ